MLQELEISWTSRPRAGAGKEGGLLLMSRSRKVCGVVVVVVVGGGGQAAAILQLERQRGPRNTTGALRLEAQQLHSHRKKQRAEPAP